MDKVGVASRSLSDLQQVVSGLGQQRPLDQAQLSKVTAALAEVEAGQRGAADAWLATQRPELAALAQAARGAPPPDGWEAAAGSPAAPPPAARGGTSASPRKVRLSFWQQHVTVPRLKKREAALQAKYRKLDASYTDAQFAAAARGTQIPDSLVAGRSSRLDVMRVAVLGADQESLHAKMEALAPQIAAVRTELKDVRMKLASLLG